MVKPVWLRRLALVVIAALAGLSYTWATGEGALEYYYAAAVRSMSMSWHNFIFGAFDPAGTITLDKLPGAFWIQALSVRAFGFHPWAIVLPQAIEGIMTVLVLYRAVSRLAGPAAGLIAALILAVSPATVALDRGNISDSLMILLLVLAADAVSAAIARGSETDSSRNAEPADPDEADPDEADPDEADGEPASPGRAGRVRRAGGIMGRLTLAAVWVGLAFQAKMIQAWMVLPALGLAYLLCGPGLAARRLVQLVVAGLVTALVSVSFMIAVSLVPAADRPYFDGSHDNSIFTQVFAYNGFTRFGDQTPLQLLSEQLKPGAALPVPRAGANRPLRGDLGRDTGWLIPAAAAVALWGLVSRRRQPRGDPLRACFILWGGWLATLFAVFSAITTINTYYTAALSPPVAAIIGAGVAAAWSGDRTAVRRRLGLAVVVAGTAAYAAWLVPSTGPRTPGWLVPVIIGVAIAALAVIGWSLLARRDALFTAALAGSMVAITLAPAVASVGLAANAASAFDVPFESARLATAVQRSAQTAVIVSLEVPQIQSAANGAPYLLAGQTTALAAYLIYDTGLEALPIGGFDGTTPVPTLSQLQADIRRGLFDQVWILAPTDARLRWVAAHCPKTSPRIYYCAHTAAR